MKLTQKLLLIPAVTFFSFSLSAFEWPQNEILSDSFNTYFGQERGGLISPSIVFSGSQEIKAADKGFVTAVLSEHDEESELFDSTLGNAVIIAHKDNMLTVYANLSKENLEERYDLTEVTGGTPLGSCGSSGWQEGNALLEFQVVDIQSKTFVNPRILMPRFGSELPLTLTGITAVNKKGTVYDLNVQKVFASGTYTIYRDRQFPAMPYTTTILVNGAKVDSITYDTLTQVKGKLCTPGKKMYPASLVYPDSKKHLIGEVVIPKGKNKITLLATDILGKEKSITYTVDAY